MSIPNRGGFIVLHRKVLESRFWTLPPAQLVVALHMLMEANWKPSAIRWCGKERQLERGQLLVSERKIAERIGVTRKVIRGTIDALRRQGMISSERAHSGAHSGTIVTFVNYCKYQDIEVVAGPASGPGEGTSKGTSRGTDHNQVTKEPVEPNKKNQPSVGPIFARTMAMLRAYVGQVTPRPLDGIDAKGVRRLLAMGVTPEGIVGRAYVGLVEAKARRVSQALSTQFDIRMERHGQAVEHHAQEVRRRFRDRDRDPGLEGQAGSGSGAEDRVPAVEHDLEACERAVESLGGEAGLVQNNPRVAAYLQSLLDGQEGTLGEPGAVDGADGGDVHRPGVTDTAMAAGGVSGARAPVAGGTRKGERRDPEVPDLTDNLPFF